MVKLPKAYNVHILGLGFLLVFTAFNTSSQIEAIVLKDFQRNGIKSDTGFYCLAILYAFFGFTSWIAPAAVELIGCKACLVLSGATYVGFVMTLYEPHLISILAMSAINGAGAALLWTANGVVMNDNSTAKTIAKNSGMFWSWFQSSAILDNTFLYFNLGDSSTITEKQRHVTFLVLAAVATLGTLAFLLLRQSNREEFREVGVEETEEELSSCTKVVNSVKKAAAMFQTTPMLLLFVPFMFTGVTLTWQTSVYITTTGNTFEKRSFLALVGISLGIGEIAGGFGWGRISNKIGRRAVVAVATLINLVAFVLILLSFPFDASKGERAVLETYIPSSLYIALACGLCLGLNDSAQTVVIYSNISKVWANNPAPAHALFRFTQSLAAAGAFLYCSYLTLPWILMIHAVLGALSLLCLFRLETVSARIETTGPDIEPLARRSSTDP